MLFEPLTIRVLALNDDNHNTCFITRQKYYSNASSFMNECLVRPHTDFYDIRFVTILDFGDRSENWTDISEDKFNYMFDLLSCTSDPMRLERNNPEKAVDRRVAFDIFWSKGQEGYWY